MAVDLLQRVGLSKYEAEAYYVLLLQGPLTGYELGKRSGVPLSKSYEVLERLTRRGLAFVQPGEPARYVADRVERFLEQTRVDQASVLSALSAALADVAPANASDEFWVARGRQNILARARALIDEARDRVAIGVWPDDDAGLDDALDRAAARGCQVVRHAPDAADGASSLLALLIDDRQALVGTLSPSAGCQAVVSGNPALALATRSVLAQDALVQRSLEGVGVAAGADTRALSAQDDTLGWLAWEDRKHQQMWRSLRGGRVA
jgi:sugar-specific transcriptional regulator TrmB